MPSVDLATVIADRPHLPLRQAVGALARCAGRTAVLLARRKIRQPGDHVGEVITFADSSRSRVYRETVVEHGSTDEPVLVVVAFRLRWVRGAGHALFRAESLLNTPLFVGFPGFVSKLWLAHDDNGLYRGVYQWDGAGRADAYVRALWWVLALVCVPGSIRYTIVPAQRRDQVLADPRSLDDAAPGEPDAWWRPTGVEHQRRSSEATRWPSRKPRAPSRRVHRGPTRLGGGSLPTRWLRAAGLAGRQRRLRDHLHRSCRHPTRDLPDRQPLLRRHRRLYEPRRHFT